MLSVHTEDVLDKSQVRILLIVLMVEYLFFIFSGVSYSFLHGAVLKYVNVDLIYWSVNLTGFPKLVVENYFVAVALDVITVLLFIFLLLKPNVRLGFITLFILLFLFYITFNTFHTHANIQLGYAIILLPFVFKSARLFSITWDFLRYYLLFFYLSAGIFKFIYGGIFDPALMSYTLKNQHALYLYFSPEHFRERIVIYLDNQPTVAWIFYILATIIELSAIVGFFTKRFDRILFVLLLLFHIGNWFLMDIGAIGMIAFLLLLLIRPIPVYQQKKYQW